MLKYVLDVNKQNVVVTRLETDVDIPENARALLEVPVGKQTTTLTPATIAGWTLVFQHVNIFFESFPVDAQEKFVRLFIYLQRQISDYYLSRSDKEELSLPEFFHSLGKVVIEFGKETDIMAKLLHFVKTYPIEFANVKDAGDRPQDRPEMTMNDDEMQCLMTCMLFSKMISPIFNTVIKQYDRLDDFETDTKIIYLMELVAGLYEETYPEFMEKLRDYIGVFVNRHKSSSDVRRIMLGITSEGTIESLYGTLLVRPFVNIDFMDDKNNPMCFVGAVINSRLRHAPSSPFSIRRPEAAHIDETDNRGTQEWDSANSTLPKHLSIIPRVAIPNIVGNYLREYDVSLAEAQEITNFYRLSPFVPTPVSKLCLRAMFGKSLGGAESISYMKFAEFAQLAIIAQIIIIHMRCYSLAHFLTTIQGSKPIAKTDINATKLRCGFDASQQYRNWMSQFTIVPDKLWRQCLEECVRYIIDYPHFYNTAPFLWEFLEQDNLNGKEIPVDYTIAAQICLVTEKFF